MTYRQLGRAADAEAELAAGRDIVESKFKSRLGTPVQGFWFDWIFARVLLRESAGLFEAPLPLR